MSPRTTKAKLVKAQMSEAEALWYSGKWIDRVPKWVSVTVFGLAMLGIWQAIYSMGFISKILLPGPLETFEEIWFTAKEIVVGPPGGGSAHLRNGLWITSKEVFLGFIAAAAGGFFLGVVVGETRLGRRAVMPYLVAFNALPKVAFAPVFVAWFGFGANSKIVMALFVAFFPVIVNTAAGLASVDADTSMLFQSMEASRWQTLRKFKLPSSLPVHLRRTEERRRVRGGRRSGRGVLGGWQRPRRTGAAQLAEHAHGPGVRLDLLPRRHGLAAVRSGGLGREEAGLLAQVRDGGSQRRVGK